MKYLVLFIICNLPVFSQNYEPNMKFNFDFMFDAQSAKELQKDYYFNERKKLKIKEIKILVNGTASLDSIYNINPKEFKNQLNQIKLPFPLNHSSFSFIEIYKYNTLGELISYNEFPICNYLTSEDSLQFRKDAIKISEFDNKTIISKWNKDTIYEQLTYQNDKLVSKYNLKEINISKIDPLTNNNIYKLLRTIELYKYTYLKNGNLDEISVNDKLILQYNYPSKNKTIITNFQFDENPEHNQVTENIILTNKIGKPISTLFYQPDYTKYKMGYLLEYDKCGNLAKIKYTEFEVGNYTDKYDYIEYVNEYKNKKLVKTTIPKINKYDEYDVIYTFNELGLIQTMNKWNRNHLFKYLFFTK